MDQAKQPEDWTRRQDRLLLHSLVDIAGDFLRRYPKYMGLATGLLLLSGLAEGIGILSLLPVLDLLLEQQGPVSGISKAFSDVFAFLGLSMTLTTALCLLVFLVTAKSAFLFASNLYGSNLQTAINRDFRLDMLRALMQARWQFFTGEPVGKLANSIVQEATLAAETARALMIIASNLIQLLIYLGAAFLISWQLTLFAIVTGVAIVFLLRIFIKITRDQGARSTTLDRDYTSRIVDLVQGLKPLKAMALEERVAPFLERETEEIMLTTRRLNFATVSISQLQEPLAAIFIAVGVILAVNVIGVETTSLLVMAALFARMVGRISAQLKAFKKLARVEAPYYAFNSKLQSIRSAREAFLDKETLAVEAKVAFEDSIDIERVGFSYGDKRILDDASLTIRSGEFVAIVGPSGSGKSTLVDMLSALLVPQEGRILIDGADLSGIDSRAWRQLIGYVPQDTMLFHASIRDNLTFGDSSIGQEAVEQALRMAGAWDFVSEMPGGLDAMAGERGLKISGGQRQRLAIARALVRRPALLLLDEATSALDSESEASICETLSKLAPEVTIIAISHRPAIECVADKTYRLERGRVVEGRSLAAPPLSAVGVQAE